MERAADECVRREVDGERVALVQGTLPADHDIDELADVFSLLGDPSRLRLLMTLLEAGELCVCDLAAATGMSESAVSHALRLLRAHRVVTVSRRGRMAFYRLSDAHVRLLLDVGMSHTAHTVAIHPERDATTNGAGA